MNALLHTHLLLSSDVSALSAYPDDTLTLATQKILSGLSHEVIEGIVSDVIALESNDRETTLKTLKGWTDSYVLSKHSAEESLLVAIAFLHCFIQNNFTGQATPTSSDTLVFGKEKLERTQRNVLASLLNVAGQPAYELCDDPVYLILALLILESLTDERSLFHPDWEHDAEITITKDIPSTKALAYWWRARAILVQLSLVSEPSGIHPIVASSILKSVDIAHAITKDLPNEATESLKKQLYTIYYLENCKCLLAIQTEHLCLPALTKAKKLTGFEFVLTGARAKRTKFQQVAHSGLIILAKSQSNENDTINNELPETFELNSDLLLEKPHFESIGAEPLDEQIIKKQKVDETNGFDDEKLLPVAVRQEFIPQALKDLDPNNQPALNQYDNIQLLLRLYTIRQTSPANNPMTEEELSALIARVLYQEGSKNWTVFSRALWERSIVETKKAKTIERGLLQMQSLVEELGLRITTKMIPDRVGSVESTQQRLKYIHQLPFIPRWSLDATLAEKYMSLGILRSAVEIYERLQMACEAALCYAAVGDEKLAEEILVKRIETNPEDARAYSILGDIRQDPALWEKSWEIGKYANAKNSLGRYYYNPPKESGLERDYTQALKHLNDSLSIFPLSFDTWYFYGCIGLECGKMNLAAEAFSRCVALDETHSLSWSNLSAAYVQLDKLKEAHSCLRRAISSDARKNWRIWDNYMIVSMKLGEWDEVLLAFRHLVDLRKDQGGETSVDLPILEKLVEILISSDYPTDSSQRLSHFQQSCLEFVCDILPSIVTTSVRLWKLVAKVELWRRRPWVALACHEKAFRAITHNPDLTIDEKIWNESVDVCEDLVAAYESLGEMEGKYGAGDVVCKNWNYKARSSIKTLMSRAKNYWEDSDGWDRLMDLKATL
ncbi:YNL313C [Kluyveromyces marxianus]|uniref:YNL313C n=1 Tax=Kluyveromyces marxianus TaxID=4911 RepID=A0ABX6F130_KLUMA|nr:YNL313C [Kluyveromyces marxianus]